MTVRGRPPTYPPWYGAEEKAGEDAERDLAELEEAPTVVDAVPVELPSEVSIPIDEAIPIEMLADLPSDEADTAPRCAAMRADGTRGCGRTTVDLGGLFPGHVLLRRDYPEQCARGENQEVRWTWCVGGPDRHLDARWFREERRASRALDGRVRP